MLCFISVGALEVRYFSHHLGSGNGSKTLKSRNKNFCVEQTYVAITQAIKESQSGGALADRVDSSVSISIHLPRLYDFVACVFCLTYCVVA